MWETVREPMAGGAGRVVEVPKHVRAFRDDTNNVNGEYRKTAAVEGKKIERLPSFERMRRGESPMWVKWISGLSKSASCLSTSSKGLPK